MTERAMWRWTYARARVQANTLGYVRASHVPGVAFYERAAARALDVPLIWASARDPGPAEVAA